MQHPSPYFLTPYSLLQAIRLPFWFACFWAVVGVAWRTPLTSVGLLAIFFVLLITVEWTTRRLTSNKLPLRKTIEIELAEQMDETMRQQITRSKTTEGQDRLNGTFCAEFPAEAMTTTVHIPFCPAFEKIPNVQVYPIDETDAHLRITSLKTFGVRIDIKRNNLEIDRLCFAIIAEG